MLELVDAPDARLLNLTALNVIVGRNGSGKSRFLRNLTKPQKPANCLAHYISPERSGTFEFEAGIANTMRTQHEWLENVRRRNQADNFKKASAIRLEDLAFTFYQKLERNENGLRDDHGMTFASAHLAKLNGMLANVYIEHVARQFVLKTYDGATIPPSELSSGESEILALGTEVLHFFETCQSEKINLLLLDEPDVHLHPDLQARFARFVIACIEELPEAIRLGTYVCLATHSMPLVAQCATYAECSLGTKSFTSTEVMLAPASAQFKKLAPFFGHPLSLMIGNELPLIIEGEDDERIWQQAGRTANGQLKIFPCVARSVTEQTELEKECARFLGAVYDEPRAISIRDADGKAGDLESIGCVERFRLQCYAAENLVLTNEVLATIGTSWPELQRKMKEWLGAHSSHRDHAAIKELADSTDRMRYSKIKQIRQLIPAICESSKPWEVLVGQAIGKLELSMPATEHSLVEYIGFAALKALGFT